MMGTVWCVRWVDSATLQGWGEAGEGHAPHVCETVGFLLSEVGEPNGGHVTIVSSLDEDGDWCNAISIPRRAILGKWVVDVS